MKYKIGIFGSAVDETPEIREKAKELAEAFTDKDVIIITGACAGLPYIIASEAAKLGTEVWGFSPELDEESHAKEYSSHDLKIYKKLYYIPANYRDLFFQTSRDPFICEHQARRKYRNIISTANCDAGIILSGRWGTLNEFTNLIDLGKVIGVLTETGGVADEIEHLMIKISKKKQGTVVFDSDPAQLVTKVIEILQKKEKEV